MKHPRIIIAAGAVVVVALSATGIASAVGMHRSATAGASSALANGAASHATKSTASKAEPVMQSVASAGSSTIHTLSATVGGKTETILVNATGLPLYTYKPDTATKSFVSGELASFWPPLTSDSPTVVGAPGKLSVTHDANGAQVAYNGHFLYTFVSDSAGHVTGQGVQDFFVATPGLSDITAATSKPSSSSTSLTPMPTPTPTPTPATSSSGSSWGY